MNNILKEIFDLNLIWKEDPRNSTFFFVELNNDIYHLRMNDFPEEIMFTLFKNEEFVTNLETNPSNWKMPYKSN